MCHCKALFTCKRKGGCEIAQLHMPSEVLERPSHRHTLNGWWWQRRLQLWNVKCWSPSGYTSNLWHGAWSELARAVWATSAHTLFEWCGSCGEYYWGAAKIREWVLLLYAPDCNKICMVYPIYLENWMIVGIWRFSDTIFEWTEIRSLPRSQISSRNWGAGIVRVLLKFIIIQEQFKI